ncbi:MAG: aldo/keto reductase [Acidobacteria bacterium]|nr:aldo/keto reductase [Acidobacteriota bacterium]
MEYRTLGRTRLRVSEIGLGAWAIGGPSTLGGRPIGWGETDDATSLRTLEACLDVGINFIDTADVYGSGHSEELVGQAFKGKRDRVIIATKVGNRDTPERGWFKDFSRKWVREAVEASLRRLQTDYIDLYQLHSPDRDFHYTPEVFDVFEELKQAGKIRYYDVSVGLWQHGISVIETGRGDALQVLFNLLQREAATGLFPLTQRHYIGIIVRVPLASGFLTGKFTAETRFPPNDHRSKYSPEQIREIVGRVERIKAAAQTLNKPLAQIALQYCLSHPAVSTVIAGAKTPEQLRQNAAASDGRLLTPEEMKELETAAG